MSTPGGKTKLVTLSGGYHEVEAVRVRVPLHFDPRHDQVWGYVGGETYARLRQHFCGLPGCHCGGVTRATIEEAVNG